MRIASRRARGRRANRRRANRDRSTRRSRSCTDGFNRASSRTWSGTPSSTAPGANVSQIASSARRCAAVIASLPPDRVALHPAWIRGSFHHAVLAPGRADSPERPVVGDDDLVAARAQVVDLPTCEPALDLDLAWEGIARVERARKVVRVERRRIDRSLKVESEVHVVQEEDERPLILLVAARRSEGEVRIAAAECERRRERRAWPLARL